MKPIPGTRTMGEQLTGIFLEFPKVKLENIFSRIEEHGYTPDCSGLKNFIIDTLDAIDRDEEPEPEKTVYGSVIRDFIERNPEAVRAAGGLMGHFAGVIMKKAGRK